MSNDWQCVLNESCVHFLLSLRLRERQQLLAVLDSLAADPMQKGSFEAKDATGRTIQLMVTGPFLISFWPDHFVKELRVINIERI